MTVRHVATLAVAFTIGIVAASSAAAMRSQARPDTIGANDVQITLKRGHAYTIPLPATAYPGAPFRVEVAAPGYNSPPPVWGWLMAVTVSYAGGSISWNDDLLGTSQAGPGQTATIDLLGNSGTQDALLQAVPVGSAEGIQLSIPSGSTLSSQTFVIRVGN